MKLTKRKTLELHIKLWSWLAENPNKGKRNWPGWKETGRIDADCPCCHYYLQENDDDDDAVDCGPACLLQWPGGVCTSRQSPYNNWKYTIIHLGDPTKYALEIVQLGQDALDKLPKRKKKPKKQPGTVNKVARHIRKTKINAGDCNETSAGKGDRPREVDRGKFEKNFAGIDWTKGRKPDDEKPYRVRHIKESDRPESRRAGTP